MVENGSGHGSVHTEKKLWGLRTSVFLPDEIINEELRVNTAFPQMFAAQSAVTGAKVIDMIADGALTWEQYRKVTLSSQQLDTARTGAVRSHKAYAIPRSRYTDYAFNRVVIKSPRTNIISAASDYAVWATEGDSDPNKNRSTWRRMREIHALFDNEDNSDQLVQLRQMWHGAAETFALPEVKKIGTAYRELFRTSGADYDFGDISSQIKGSMTDQIEQAVSGNVPKPVVERFVDNLNTFP